VILIYGSAQGFAQSSPFSALIMGKAKKGPKFAVRKKVVTSKAIKR